MWIGKNICNKAYTLRFYVCTRESNQCAVSMYAVKKGTLFPRPHTCKRLQKDKNKKYIRRKPNKMICASTLLSALTKTPQTTDQFLVRVPFLDLSAQVESHTEADFCSGTNGRSGDDEVRVDGDSDSDDGDHCVNGGDVHDSGGGDGAW